MSCTGIFVVVYKPGPEGKPDSVVLECQGDCDGEPCKKPRITTFQKDGRPVDTEAAADTRIQITFCSCDDEPAPPRRCTTGLKSIAKKAADGSWGTPRIAAVCLPPGNGCGGLKKCRPVLVGTKTVALPSEEGGDEFFAEDKPVQTYKIERYRCECVQAFD